jgi:fatty acid desaturase
MTLSSISQYAHELRPHLPASVFSPVPARLWWLALHGSVVAVGVWAIAVADLGWPIDALISVAIGLAFAGMAFVAHEALHGALVRPRWARLLIGGIGFLPFAISPRHWIAWHNRLHHGHTSVAGVDPDAYPTLERYQKNRHVRWSDHLSLGGRRPLGSFSLLFGLCVQSLEVLLSAGPRARYLSRPQHRLALVETAAAIVLWGSLSVWLGAGVLVFGWLIPIVIGSTIVMAHILTNHSLSSLTEINDPLANSLSVTVPRWFSIYTLQFGLHVEHHLFPTVSARHAPCIRDLIQERWPGRYRSLPLAGALGRLFTTGRIYKNRTTLYDPATGESSPTL